MDSKNSGVIGIVGGMGPQAGIALFNSILYNTDATTDQQHFSVVLMSFPGQIADRTFFLEGGECENPAYKVAETVRKLVIAGATTIGIACNTCHTPRIYDVICEELQRMQTQVNLLHMPMETCAWIKRSYPAVRRVGVMSTNGTYWTGIYEKTLQSMGFEAVIPEYAFQDGVIHKLIYDGKIGIKANPKLLHPQARSLMHKAFRFFREQGAEAVILGCTDLSMALKDQRVSGMIVVDSTECLAGALIREVTSVCEMASATDNYGTL